MIDKNDVYTSPLLTDRLVGRPRKPNALTPAQRAKIYRAKKKLKPGHPNVMYRGPNGCTWSGKGQHPAWVRNLIERGANIEFFKVANCAQ